MDDSWLLPTNCRSLREAVAMVAESQYPKWADTMLTADEAIAIDWYSRARSAQDEAARKPVMGLGPLASLASLAAPPPLPLLPDEFEADELWNAIGIALEKKTDQETFLNSAWQNMRQALIDGLLTAYCAPEPLGTHEQVPALTWCGRPNAKSHLLGKVWLRLPPDSPRPVYGNAYLKGEDLQRYLRVLAGEPMETPHASHRAGAEDEAIAGTDKASQIKLAAATLKQMASVDDPSHPKPVQSDIEAELKRRYPALSSTDTRALWKSEAPPRWKAKGRPKKVLMRI